MNELGKKVLELEKEYFDLIYELFSELILIYSENNISVEETVKKFLAKQQHATLFIPGYKDNHSFKRRQLYKRNKEFWEKNKETIIEFIIKEANVGIFGTGDNTFISEYMSEIKRNSLFYDLLVFNDPFYTLDITDDKMDLYTGDFLFYMNILYIWEIKRYLSVEEIEEKMFLAINEIAIYMYTHYPEEKEYSIKITNFKQIENADFLEKTDGKRSRSLFDRVDDKLIFAHKSLLEYFLALSFDRLDFRYEQHLNTLYKFLRESVGKNWEAKYAPLFLINYADESPEIVKYNENESYVEVRSNNVPTDRTFVEKMVRWYSAAFRLPVFLDTKIYERSKIEFVLHNGSQFYHVLMVADNDVEEIIDRIMYRIKNGVAWREAVNLKVITSLERNPVHN